MKKLMSIITAGVLSAALLAGCGSSTGSTGTQAESVSSDTVENNVEDVTASDSEAADEDNEETDETASDENDETAAADTDETSLDGSGASAAQETGIGSKILVLYYSGTGHTKSAADMIAADTGADEFEITPSEPYTDEDLDWTNEDSRVNKEHEDESLQNIAFDSYDVPDWDSYDTVFVGYPIWWQDASWVMKSYVQHLDFTGKTVIPFCTSSASGIGDSGKNLETLAGSGNWIDGQRFGSSPSEDEVKSWVDSLDL